MYRLLNAEKIFGLQGHSGNYVYTSRNMRTLYHYSTHLVFSVCCVFTSPPLMVSNGRRSPSSGFLKCPRFSATKLPHNYKLSKEDCLHKDVSMPIKKVDFSETELMSDKNSRHGPPENTFPLLCMKFMT
jgi:hypothetical protein